MSNYLQRKRVARLFACPVAFAVSACTTVMNPYLDTAATDKRPDCAKEQTCTPEARFKGIRNAVESTRDQARKAYTERAEIGSWTSALAFPLTAGLLYAGATRTTDGARNRILGWGLGLASVYEARNALLAGSPESIYILAELRLACVADEAYKYDLKQPDASNCGAKRKLLVAEIAKVQGLNPTAEMSIKRDTYIAQANGALEQYTQRDRTISAAADAMQNAMRKIVSNTNAQIRTASASPAAATALLKSELAIIQPGSKLDTSKVGTTGSGDSDQKVATELNTLIDQIDDFAQACVVPQPSSPAAFDACTTYSPDVPPVPTLTTSLPGKAFDMSPGATKTFTVTSQPTGTPWADFGGDTSVATAALGHPQIVTLTPTQSQITLNYTTAVTKETVVALNLTTVGVTGNALPLTITLKPGATGQNGANAGAAAATPIDPKLTALKKDACLMRILKITAPYNEQEIQARLQVKWQNSNQGTPSTDQLTDPAFITKLKTDGKLNPSKCK